MKCDNCDKNATVHLTEVRGGNLVQRHVCEQCAADEEGSISPNMPIHQLLTEFVMAHTARHTGDQSGAAPDKVDPR